MNIAALVAYLAVAVFIIAGRVDIAASISAQQYGKRSFPYTKTTYANWQHGRQFCCRPNNEPNWQTKVNACETS